MSDALAASAREHVDKITASVGFQNSDRLCRFLRFIVEAKLRGEQDQIKEYVIGKEVFDRDGAYDPRLDPIVRVEARRLRKKLEEYYFGPGSNDVVRIAFPKGAYVPEILEIPAPEQSVPTVPAETPSRRTNWRWVSAAATMLALLLALFAWTSRPQGNDKKSRSIAVIPARWIWPAEDFPDLRHDEDLAERIAAALARQHPSIQVAAWPMLQRFRNGGTSKVEQIARETSSSLAMVVAVRVESDGFRVTSYLIDPLGGRKLNVADRRTVALTTPAQREQFAAGLAKDFVLPK